MKDMKIEKLPKPVLQVSSIVLCQLAGVIGSLATTPAIPTWFDYLNKPTFSPPNWLFAPVWLTLYAMMGIAFYLIIVKGLKNKKKRIAAGLFLGHLVLNTLWSLVFFGLKDLGLALLVIILLWLMIAILIDLFWKIEKRASLLLIPYFLWVSFATFLNLALWQLN